MRNTHLECLEAAQDEIDEVERIQNPKETSVCPRTRVTPPCGWMGAPMAPVFFKGRYHVYYPFTPYTVTYGRLYLGHSSSSDLKSWVHHRPILAPNEPYDFDGTLGGSVIESDGELFLFYTGLAERGPINGIEIIDQVVCLATSEDGQNFTKIGPVITPPDEIRRVLNPKVWKGKTGWWLAVAIEFLDEETPPAIYLYSSEDLESWRFARTLLECGSGEGEFWEMPDFFELDGEQLIFLTTKGLAQAQYDAVTNTDYSNQNLHQCGVIRGEYTEGGAFTVRKPFTELDKGTDFFGAQTFLAEDGRRLMIAWANMPGDMQPTIYYGFCGVSTFVRELSIVDGQLCQKPARELAEMYDFNYLYPASHIDNDRTEITDDAPAFAFEIAISLENTSASTFGLALGEGFKLEFVRPENANPDDSKLLTHFSRNYLQMGLYDSRLFTWPEGKALVVRGHYDRSVIEIFIDDYPTPFSFRVCPDIGDRKLVLFAIDGVMKTDYLNYWTLNPKK